VKPQVQTPVPPKKKNACGMAQVVREKKSQSGDNNKSH
jgi:hypothetical protein